MFFPSFTDTMVCTGCCSSLDHIVTYLFKQLSRSTKKRAAPMAQESDRFLHIMQQHPEMIQQVRWSWSLNVSSSSGVTYFFILFCRLWFQNALEVLLCYTIGLAQVQHTNASRESMERNQIYCRWVSTLKHIVLFLFTFIFVSVGIWTLFCLCK